MRSDRTDSRVLLGLDRQDGDGNRVATPILHEESLGELFKRLSADSTHLIQQEMALAKVELREGAASVTRAGGKLGIAIGLALPGILAVTAAVVIVLGILIHSYWGSALIVGIALLLVTRVLLKRALAQLKSAFAPTETMRSVREDVDWAKHETTRVKRELTA